MPGVVDRDSTRMKYIFVDLAGDFSEVIEKVFDKSDRFDIETVTGDVAQVARDNTAFISPANVLSV